MLGPERGVAAAQALDAACELGVALFVGDARGVLAGQGRAGNGLGVRGWGRRVGGRSGAGHDYDTSRDNVTSQARAK